MLQTSGNIETDWSTGTPKVRSNKRSSLSSVSKFETYSNHLQHEERLTGTCLIWAMSIDAKVSTFTTGYVPSVLLNSKKA